MNQLKEQIELILLQQGPLTGKALSDLIKSDPLTLWRSCKNNKNLYIKSAARRYLRLDKKVSGYARLSPSIKREFFTYTLISLKKDRELALKYTLKLKDNIRRISNNKLELTKEIIGSIISENPKHKEINKDFIFIIAGDIVFNMAHSEPRPERSTGELVCGSDLDIIVIYRNSVKKSIVEQLDKQIYKKKSELLRMPGRAEEIDYVLKNMSKVYAQLKFDTFEHKIACKLLDEGNFLYGNRKMFIGIKDLIKKDRLPDTLKQLKKIAVKNRTETEKKLLKRTSPLSEEEYLKLFYTTEEGEEIF